MHQSLGILGGLGPLASAEFLKTIYEFNLKALEQQSPTCILYSDPTFPDRTDAILSGSDDLLVSLLVKYLQILGDLGVSKIVIACVTMHYFLPKVPVPLRKKVISLLDLIIKEVLNTSKLHLLLCTNGVRQADVFQKHEHWSLIEQYVLLPDLEDQNMLQSYIYQLKLNADYNSIVRYLDTLVCKSKVDSLIAGCTEFHLVKKHLMKLEDRGQEYQLIDPLLIIAKKFNQLMDM